MHDHAEAGGAPFIAMWTVMMVGMMLPSLAPTLRRSSRPLVLAAGYFAVWTVLGVAVHAAGLAASLPAAGGSVMLVAGVLQFTPWKAHHLACVRAAANPAVRSSDSTAAAWCIGLRLGLHCICSCAGPTAALLALGTMDLRAMALATAVITAECLAPRGALVAQVSGAAAVIVGAAAIWTAATP